MTKRRLLYLIGAPGTGKTSALRLALDDFYAERDGRQALEVTKSGYEMPHVEYTRAGAVLGAQLGSMRRGREGVDGLFVPNVDAQATLFLKHWRNGTNGHLVLGEGDRLATDSFWHEAMCLGYILEPLWLVASPDVCLAREQETGETAWTEDLIRVRHAKAQGLAKRWNAATIDAERQIGRIAADIKRTRTVSEMLKA